MAITFIAFTDSGVAAAGSISAVKPASVTTGDKMIALLWSSGASFSAPSGWTQVGTTQNDASFGSGVYFAVFYKDDNGTAGPYAFSSAGYMTVVIVGYRGAVAGAPNQSNPQINGAGTTMPNSGVTPSAAGETLVYAGISYGGTVTTGSAGYTARTNNVSEQWYVQDKIGAGGGASGTVSLTYSNSYNSDTWMLALAPPATPSRQRMVL